MDLDDRIKPFQIVHDDDSTSVILNAGDYRNEVFELRSADGIEGNGYDWAALAAVFLDEQAPHLKAAIRFDPEAGIFCAYSKNLQALEEFTVAFHVACEDDARIRDLLSRAEPD